MISIFIRGDGNVTIDVKHILLCFYGKLNLSKVISNSIVRFSITIAKFRYIVSKHLIPHISIPGEINYKFKIAYKQFYLLRKKSPIYSMKITVKRRFFEYEITIGRAHYLPRHYEGTRYCTYFPIVLKLTHPRKCLRSSHELTILPSLSLSFQ